MKPVIVRSPLQRYLSSLTQQLDKSSLKKQFLFRKERKYFKQQESSISDIEADLVVTTTVAIVVQSGALSESAIYAVTLILRGSQAYNPTSFNPLSQQPHKKSEFDNHLINLTHF